LQDFVRFTSARNKDNLMKAFLTRKLEISRKVLLDKINSGVVLDSSSWMEKIFLLTKSRDDISVERKIRIRRNALGENWFIFCGPIVNL